MSLAHRYHPNVRYAVDLGNSAAKAAPLGAGTARPLRVAAPADPAARDAWAAQAEALLDLLAAEATPLTGLLVASVVPAATAALRHATAIRGLAMDELLAADIPLQLAIDEPARIGVDRLLAAWHAYERVGRPAGRGAVAVTLGTALTLTCVDRQGRVLGGAIAPSPLLAARALARGTAALPEVALYDERPELPGPIGASTEAALASGILRGARGALVALVAESIAEMQRRDPGAPAPAVALGGGAAGAGWSATVDADLRDADLVLNAMLALAALPATARRPR